MRGTIIDYEYIPGGNSELVQGVKGGAVPKNAICGGNGSFIVADPAKIFLGISFDGRIHRKYEVGGRFRGYLHHNKGIARVTKKRVENICKQLLGREVNISENGSTILDLEDLLNSCEIN